MVYLEELQCYVKSGQCRVLQAGQIIFCMHYHYAVRCPDTSPKCSKSLTISRSRVIFFSHFVLAVVSCFPTKADRAKQAEKKQRKLDFEENVLKSPSMVPPTPGFPQSPVGRGWPPMTPRTQAFNTLGGTTDLPLRDRVGSAAPQNLSIPDSAAASPSARTSEQPQMYFPPPPKSKSGK